MGLPPARDKFGFANVKRDMQSSDRKKYIGILLSDTSPQHVREILSESLQ